LTFTLSPASRANTPQIEQARKTKKNGRTRFACQEHYERRQLEQTRARSRDRKQLLVGRNRNFWPRALQFQSLSLGRNFLGDIADHRQLESLALVRFDHALRAKSMETSAGKIPLMGA
jgi:hypothetical protein